jgi:lipopolysaccharide transport system ATP-binding protein
MSDRVIEVTNLGKRYHIGRKQARSGTFAEAVINSLLVPFQLRRVLGQQSESENVLWALKDVSLTLNKGDTLAIIGRNGSGKSTFLKIISRITNPTEGRVKTRGKVASLLEVGTGFHPELTGRENIFLNGVILGMKYREIASRLDEIVAFAEVEKFLDTPIKHYSSGMQVRLAFSVAAHLSPQILLVDEVLAVGDLWFQEKCIARMTDLISTGRTVLLVSHQLNTVRKLSQTCLWLDAGRVRMIGPTAEVVSAYESNRFSDESLDARADDSFARPARFLDWEIEHPKGLKPNWLTTIGPVTLRVRVQINEEMKEGNHGIALFNDKQQLMWAWSNANVRLSTGLHEFVYQLPTLPLRPGNYQWFVQLKDKGKEFDNWHCTPPMVIATMPLTHPMDNWTGILNVPVEFRVERSRGGPSKEAVDGSADRHEQN